jgi:hypothetical protein
MIHNPYVRWCLIGCVWLSGLLVPKRLEAQEHEESPAKTAYLIVLKSRSGAGVPTRNRPARAAGGDIEVVQSAPDRVRIIMRGATIAGSEYRLAGRSDVAFALDQDFDIEPTKRGLRPAVLTLSGQLIGAMQSSQPIGGLAEHAPACASVCSGGAPIAQFCIKPHTVGSTERLFINDRQVADPITVVPGRYSLNQVFSISTSAPELPACQVFPKIVPAASAVFMPDPKFDTRFTYVLQAFGSVPRNNFGFVTEIHVTEAPAGMAEPGKLPAPRPEPVQ